MTKREIFVHKEACIRTMYKNVGFTIVCNRENLETIILKWQNKLWHICSKEYHSRVKKEEILTWKTFKNIFLIEKPSYRTICTPWHHLCFFFKPTEPKIIFLDCVHSGPHRSRCQETIRCARDSFRETPVKDKGRCIRNSQGQPSDFMQVWQV